MESSKPEGYRRPWLNSMDNKTKPEIIRMVKRSVGDMENERHGSEITQNKERIIRTDRIPL